MPEAPGKSSPPKRPNDKAPLDPRQQDFSRRLADRLEKTLKPRKKD